MDKKAMGLPINIVVMMIIGLVIFGLGMGLFSRISSSAEGEISSLSNQVRNDINSLECKDEKWVCSPSYSMKNGAEETFQVFIANQADSQDKFKISLVLEDIDNGKKGLSKECGDLIISHVPSLEVSIKSGYSGSLPFIAKATRIKDTPCNFVTTASLTSENGIEESTPVIIRVE